MENSEITKPRRGRPPKRPEDRAEKGKGKNVPLVEADRALVATAANLDRIPATTWCRNAILTAARKRIAREKTNGSSML